MNTATVEDDSVISVCDMLAAVEKLPRPLSFAAVVWNPKQGQAFSEIENFPTETAFAAMSGVLVYEREQSAGAWLFHSERLLREYLNATMTENDLQTISARFPNTVEKIV